jgi:hypothetical protein
MLGKVANLQADSGRYYTATSHGLEVDHQAMAMCHMTHVCAFVDIAVISVISSRSEL